MLADFRFVLGAVLAVAMLAVGGLGVVTSVALMREAHIAPVEGSRSLAYAGPATRNAFYDPDAARRFEGAGGEILQVEPPAEIVEDKDAEVPHATEDPPAAVEAPAAPSAERVASAPAMPISASEPGPAPVDDELSPAAVPPAQSQGVPQPHPKPLFRKRVARAHIRRTFVARPQYSAFTSPWPSFGWQVGARFGTQFGSTTGWRRNQLGGSFDNRHQ